MAEINLEWIEAGRLNTRQISPKISDTQSGMTRIGRDPNRCDVVLADGSVSGLHIGIGYDAESYRFYVQNLRESNPPVINGQPLTTGRVFLLTENTIQLGNVQLRAIATINTQPNPIPPTDLSIPPEAVPPTAVAPPAPAQATVEARSPYVSPTAPTNNPPVAYPNNIESAPVSKGGSKSWGFILGGCALMLGLFGLAWPNISDFLGIGRGTIVSESNMPSSKESSESSETQSSDDETVSMSDLESYTHPQGLFAIDIPENWVFLDNSQPGRIVIQGWHHPQLNAYVIVRIFEAGSRFNRSALEEFSADLVDELFNDLDNFERSAPTTLSNQSVRIQWNADDGPDTLLAATFVRQDNLHISAINVWAPEGASNFEELEKDIELIVASYEVDPGVSIP